MRHPGFQSAPRDDDAALLARVRARVLATIRTHAAPKETVRAGHGGELLPDQGKFLADVAGLLGLGRGGG
jgi:hypothetical protein